MFDDRRALAKNKKLQMAKMFDERKGEKLLCVVCQRPAGKRSLRHSWIICENLHINFIHTGCIKNISSAASRSKQFFSYVNDQGPELILNEERLNAERKKLGQLLAKNIREETYRSLLERMTKKIEQERTVRELGDTQISFGFHEVYFKPFPGNEVEYVNLCRRIKDEMLVGQPGEIVEAFKNTLVAGY